VEVRGYLHNSAGLSTGYNQGTHRMGGAIDSRAKGGVC